MQHDKRAAFGFQGDRRGIWPGRRIERCGDQLAAFVMEALAQRPAMSPSERHQAAVVAIGIVEGDPEARHGRGHGVQVGGVLVPADLTANPGLFEEIHRLQQQRLSEAK